MHVCHLTSSHNRYDSRIFRKMCLSTIKKGHSVTLVCADGLGCASIDGVEVIDVGMPKHRLARLWNAPRRIKHIAKRINADLYQLHDPELLRIVPYLRRCQKKIIFDMHENFIIQLASRKIAAKPLFGKILVWAFKMLEQFYIKQCDGLIVAQPDMVPLHQHLNNNICPISNYAILEGHPKLKQLSHLKSLIYAGTISDDRGLGNMLSLMRFLPDDYVLNLAGFVEKDLQSSIRKEFKNRVIFHGLLEQRELKKLYADCGIGLILFNNVGQYYMANSIKLFEYMQSGLLVIMPDFGHWVTFNAHFKAGEVVDTTNGLEIAKKISSISLERLIDDGRMNFQNVKKYFNWNQEFKNLDVFYDQVVPKIDPK